MRGILPFALLLLSLACGPSCGLGTGSPTTTQPSAMPTHKPRTTGSPTTRHPVSRSPSVSPVATPTTSPVHSAPSASPVPAPSASPSQSSSPISHPTAQPVAPSTSTPTSLSPTTAAPTTGAPTPVNMTGIFFHQSAFVDMAIATIGVVGVLPPLTLCLFNLCVGVLSLAHAVQVLKTWVLNHKLYVLHVFMSYAAIAAIFNMAYNNLFLSDFFFTLSMIAFLLPGLYMSLALFLNSRLLGCCANVRLIFVSLFGGIFVSFNFAMFLSYSEQLLLFLGEANNYNSDYVMNLTILSALFTSTPLLLGMIAWQFMDLYAINPSGVPLDYLLAMAALGALEIIGIAHLLAAAYSIGSFHNALLGESETSRHGKRISRGFVPAEKRNSFVFRFGPKGSGQIPLPAGFHRSAGASPGHEGAAVTPHAIREESQSPSHVIMARSLVMSPPPGMSPPPRPRPPPPPPRLPPQRTPPPPLPGQPSASSPATTTTLSPFSTRVLSDSLTALATPMEHEATWY